MAEAAFSEDGKYFSTISQDGRLRIWDTETNSLKQEYTPDLHLTAPPSCIQWITVTQLGGHQPKNARRKSVNISGSEHEIPCVALGTKNGKIIIYSVAHAKVETVLENEKSGMQKNGITCLDWNRNNGLYSCCRGNFIASWDIQSASVSYKYNLNVDDKNMQAISAIKIIQHKKKTPSVFMVTSSWQVRVWRLHEGEAEIIKCLGHNAAPKALLAVTNYENSNWLIEGSQTERLLQFWDVTITADNIPQINGDTNTTPTKKKRKKSISGQVVPTPTNSFVLEDAPKMIDFAVRGENGGTKLSLAAATRSGVVHYYCHMLNGASIKPIKPSLTVQVTTADAAPLPLQCCRLPPTSDLLIGYSHNAALVFERVTPDFKSKTQVLIRGDMKLTQPKNKKKNKQAEANKTKGEANADDVTYVEPMGGAVSRKRATPGGKVEVPMEQRLSNLSLDPKSRAAPPGHNLTKLLMQGLHSQDKKIISSVLAHSKPSVAAQTVRGLPPDGVALLLQQLANMAANRTTQCASVVVWVTAVLRCHAALLLAASGAAAENHLTRLLAIFTQRRSHLCQLLNLRGRLELTGAQREQTLDDTLQQRQQQQAVLIYEDTSDDSDMEVGENEGQSGSEESWCADESEEDKASGDGHLSDKDEDSDDGNQSDKDEDSDDGHQSDKDEDSDDDDDK